MSSKTAVSSPVDKVLAVLVVLLGIGVCPGVWAAAPVDIYSFADAEEESKYRRLIDEFRCPKCLNTNLSGSDAPIAMDLRRTVHRLVTVEHLSNDQVRTYLQERYGDFVLYDPPFKRSTWVLWLAPVGFVLISMFVLLRLLRQSPAEPLSVTEAQQIRTILDED